MLERNRDMNTEQNIKKFILLFNAIIGKISLKSSLFLSNSDVTKKKIEKFFSNFFCVDDDLLWQYLIYQFSRYEISPYPITLDKIISNQSVEKWKNRTKQEIFYTHSFKTKYGIVKDIIPYKMSEDYKNLMRNKHKDQYKQLVFCQEFEGYLYDKKKCSKCKNFEICKKILSQK